MKIRTDFVTNSSSSSFVLARKNDIPEEARQAIMKYLEKKLFGEPILRPDATEDEIQKAEDEKYRYFSDDLKEEIRKALGDGKTVYMGDVSFDEPDYGLRDIYQTIWDITEKNDPDFEIVSGSLMY